MNTRPRPQLAAALAAALLAGACGESELSGPPGPGPGTQDAQLRITALVVGTPIDLMVAHVSAADIAVPLVFNLPVVDGVATGTLRIPPGADRTITLEAFDELGNVTHEGSVTIDVQSGANPPVNIAMLPRSGDIPVTATLAEFSVIITPTSASMAADGSFQFTAQILDVDDNPLSGTVVWAVTNPAFARINQAGLATGVAPGTLLVVASFGGVAGTAQLQVTDGVSGMINGTVSSPLLGPLGLVEVTAGAASTFSDEEGGTYLLAGIPEGPATVALAGLPPWCTPPATQQVQVVAGQAVQADFTVTCTLGVIITEVMAWPVGTAVDQVGELGEWIELYNGGSAPVDISGWLIGYAIVDNQLAGCTVGSGVIQPGAHVVVGRVTSTAQNGGVQNVIPCSATVSLSNATLTEMRLQGVVLAAWDYAAAGTPVQGAASSLSAAAYHPVTNDNPASWCPATTSYGTAGNLGTPGQPNPACTLGGGQVIITEIMRNPAGTGVDANGQMGEWVEVFNGTGASVDISGWTLEHGATFHGCRVGSGTIEAGSHVVIGRTVNPADNGGIANMVGCQILTGSFPGFDNTGALGVTLKNAQGSEVDGVTMLTGAIQGTSWSLSPAGYGTTANNDNGNWCDAVTPYGTAGNLGTPGQLNLACP